MEHVSQIIDRFGGIRPMASALGYPVSTVHSWKVRGSIPDSSKMEIIAKSDQLGLGLQIEDFFPRNRGAA